MTAPLGEKELRDLLIDCRPYVLAVKGASGSQIEKDDADQLLYRINLQIKSLSEAPYAG